MQKHATPHQSDAPFGGGIDRDGRAKGVEEDLPTSPHATRVGEVAGKRNAELADNVKDSCRYRD